MDSEKIRKEIEDLRKNNIINQTEYDLMISRLDPVKTFCELIRNILNSEIDADQSSFFTPTDVCNILLRHRNKIVPLLKGDR